LGGFETLLADDSALVLRRTLGAESVVAAFNLSATPRELDWAHGGAVAASVGDVQVVGHTLKLGAWSALITTRGA